MLSCSSAEHCLCNTWVADCGQLWPRWPRCGLLLKVCHRLVTQMAVYSVHLQSAWPQIRPDGGIDPDTLVHSLQSGYLGAILVPSPLAYVSFQVHEAFTPHTVASVSIITYHSASGVFFMLLRSKCILDQVDYSFKR